VIERYIGLISGTSMDAIDAVLVGIGEDDCALEATRSHSLDATTLRGMRRLVEHPEDAGLEVLGELDVALGREFAAAAVALLADAGLAPTDVRAIGSHGQTVLHSPRGRHPFTMQIGDPNVIAANTGITTVADFRRRDIALGGEGAPLVPAFHKAAFGSAEEHRAVLNIGGIANLTLLSPDGAVSGFDTGPGNTLMDSWTRRYRGQPYDEQGSWAASAEPNAALLEELLQHEYFGRPPPKSTGVEEFNLLWLQGILDGLRDPVPPDAVQATLCELTARSVAASLESACPDAGGLFLCGGGARNAALVARLGTLLPGWRIEPTDALGIGADWVEATAIAWLAHRTLVGLPGNVPAVTGASRETILGAIYPA
jgi:anhydro-N-acetylmuramic acid kinase